MDPVAWYFCEFFLLYPGAAVYHDAAVFHHKEGPTLLVRVDYEDPEAVSVGWNKDAKMSENYECKMTPGCAGDTNHQAWSALAVDDPASAELLFSIKTWSPSPTVGSTAVPKVHP